MNSGNLIQDAMADDGDGDSDPQPNSWLLRVLTGRNTTIAMLVAFLAINALLILVSIREVGVLAPETAVVSIPFVCGAACLVGVTRL